MSFSDLGLSAELLQAIADAGYTQPTPIQAQAIPHVLAGRDMLGCAQTGTGKTASFTLPMIEILSSGRAKARMPRTLILEPTRELAAQVAENFDKYGKYHRLTKALLIGGVSFADQEKLIDRGVDVLIATPGRLLDHFERGKILLTDVKILVIDEADRMMDMGFMPDVERIVGLLPPLRQTLFFSATMSPEMRRLANKFLSNPKEVSVAPPATTADTVAQHLVVLPDEDQKREALRRVISAEEVGNALIFCNRKRDVTILHKSLQRHGLDAGALHGDMSQPARMETLAKFKAGEIRLLVCSDVAARGLDISGLSHVFNFDVPFNAEDYVHRIGRTGRAGRKGVAVTLATPGDGKYLDAIERLLKKPLPRAPLPEGFTLSEAAQRPPRREDARKSRKPRDRDEGRRAEERRERPVKPHGHEAPRTPLEVPSPRIEAAPAQSAALAEDRPRRNRTAEERPKRDRGPDRDRHGGRDQGAPVVGLGDHVPDFLLRGFKPEKV
ncbi:MAG: DEAD/DEAH box helicase [Thalassobaculales bacterium]